MPKDLYDQLSNPDLLRKAWHLARNSSLSGFMRDPFRYSDFASQLDDHLQGISRSIEQGFYHPQPLLTIDVPKSTLSVRPGSVLEIEDHITLFAIVYLIAPILDKKVPKNVYSWRIKKKPTKKQLFWDQELVKYPFLKKSTIQRHIDILNLGMNFGRLS